NHCKCARRSGTARLSLSGRVGVHHHKRYDKRVTMTIFEIPESRLSELDDAVLRELVARLCEAERERSGGHRAEVRWGGAQTAADGGMDVMVDALSDFEPNTV